MSSRVKLGMLTPSSNTVLEPMTYNMIAGLPQVSAHFSRFKVVEISLEQTYLSQFDDSLLLAAAERLAEARVDVIAWNGTSSGWLGFKRDEQLCRAITRTTGIPATTSMLAMNEVLLATRCKRYGLVTPYLSDVQQRIIASYEGLGLQCAAETHLELKENYAFGEVDDWLIRDRVVDVAKARPDAVAIICTNLRAAHLVKGLEAELGIPVYDTVATAIWKSLQMAGVATDQITDWGSLFSQSGLTQSIAQ